MRQRCSGEALVWENLANRWARGREGSGEGLSVCCFRTSTSGRVKVSLHVETFNTYLFALNLRLASF